MKMRMNTFFLSLYYIIKIVYGYYSHDLFTLTSSPIKGIMTMCLWTWIYDTVED